MKNYKFTIIINVYNLDLFYIKRSIESVINQKYKNYECYIIDDGSKKEFKFNEYYKNIMINFKKIKYIYQENIGIGPSRNIGIKYAKSDYVIFLDGDDFISIDCLYHLNNLLNKYGLVDMIHFNHVLVKNNKWKEKNKKYIEYVKSNDNNLSLSDFKQLQRLKFCYNLNFIKNNNLYFYNSKNPHEDVYYNLISKTLMKTIVFTNKELYFYDISRKSSFTNTGKLNDDKKFIDYILLSFDFLSQTGKNIDRFYLYIIHYLNIFINQKYLKQHWERFFVNNFYLKNNIGITKTNKIIYFFYKHNKMNQVINKIFRYKWFKKIIKKIMW